MTDANQLEVFLRDYAQYTTSVLSENHKRVKLLLKQWRQPTYWSLLTPSTSRPDPSPIQRTRVRVKRPESVVDKIFRKPDDYPNRLSPTSFQSMPDVLGTRIIVYFATHLPLIDGEIRRCERFEISKRHPPIGYLSQKRLSDLGLSHIRGSEKESGYASIHYIVRLTDPDLPESHRPWFEMQVRTIAEDLWAEVEHILGYKPHKNTSQAVRRQFRILSDQLATIDDYFCSIFEELGQFQDTVALKPDDLLNAENLKVVLTEAGLSCAQSEVDGILKLLFSRGVQRVSDFRRLATAQRNALIKNVFRHEKRRDPTNFELIASLATLPSASTATDECNLIRAHIQYLDAWDSLKREISRNESDKS